MKKNSLVTTKNTGLEGPTSFPKETEKIEEQDEAIGEGTQDFLSEEEEIKSLSIVERKKTQYYKALEKKEKVKAAFYEFAKWVIGILAVVIVGFGVFYFQNISEPIGRIKQAIEDLQARTSEDKKEIKDELQRQEDEIKQIQKEMNKP